MMSKLFNKYAVCVFLLVIIYLVGKSNVQLRAANTALKQDLKKLQKASDKNDVLTSGLFLFEKELYERTDDINQAIPELYDYHYSDDFMQLYRKALGY